MSQRVILRTRHIPPIWPILAYWSWDIEKTIGVNKGEIVNVWRDGHYTGIWDADAMKELGEYTVSKLMNESDLEAVRARAAEAGERVHAHCSAFAQGVSERPTGQFAEFLRAFIPLHHEFTQANMLLWLFSSDVLEREIQAVLSGNENVKEIISVMSRPVGASYSDIEERAFADLVRVAKECGIDHVSTQRQIADFSEKYIWFPYEYCGPAVFDVPTVTRRVAEAIEKGVLVHPERDIFQEQKDCIARYGLSAEVQRLFQVLQTVAMLQDDRKMLNARLCYVLNGQILPALGERYGFSRELSWYLDPECIEKLASGTDVSAELSERQKFFVVTSRDDGGESYTGTAARNALKERGIDLDGPRDVTELKGQIAQGGVKRGTVRLLKSSSYDGEFQDGDILVSGMTTPDFIMFMKRAGAIITDEGGITCHAAIVSRELGKPCIIGTKIATKVLKDGDVVEVDAEKGVVSVLSRG